MSKNYDVEELINESLDAQGNAYSPYSDFPVGCAVLTTDGSIYKGCNVENMTFTNTIHAEQTAMVKAISNGASSFEAVAITVSDKSDTPPCGICRETLAEHCSLDTDIIVNLGDGDYSEYILGELIPDDMRQQNNLDE